MVRSSRHKIRDKLEFEEEEIVVQPTLPMPPMERLKIRGGDVAAVESNKIMKMPKFKSKLDVHANKNNIKLIL